MPIANNNEIFFDAYTHTYYRVWEDGSKEPYISVTQLMKKHGLTTNYDHVPSATLKKAAERGTLIHEEIENYINNRELGFTTELDDFIDICNANKLNPVMCEFVVYNDEYKIAGTVDNLGEWEGGEFWLGDNKTTQKLNTDALAWQLSIYHFLSDKGALIDRYIGFHLLPDNQSKLVDITPIDRAKVVELLELEKAGELLAQPKAQVEIVNQDKIVELQKTIEFHEMQAKNAQKKLDELKQGLLLAMENNNVKTFENDLLKITYIAPSTRTTIDGTKLKKEMPEIAEKYTKTSNVKASIRITLRGENEEQSE